MTDMARLFQIVLFDHPIHPLLVNFPVALSLTGLLLALLAWLRKDAALDKAAFYDLILCTLSIFPAMAAGIIENQTRYNGHAPNAMLKIALGSLLLLVAIGTTLWRWRRPTLLSSAPTAYVYLLAFAVCAGLTSFLGVLGGIIVFGA